MNCQEIKSFLYDHALGEGELTAEVRGHLEHCAVCRVEAAACGVTAKLLRQGLPEEEPPRRMVFVAETKSAPNPLRFWQWSFASAAAFAMFFAGLALRQPAAIARPPAGEAPVTAAVRGVLSRDEVRTLVDAAVRAAVAESEWRQRAETTAILKIAATRMTEQLYTLQSTQSIVYKQAEQNRADLRQLATMVGRGGEE